MDVFWRLERKDNAHMGQRYGKASLQPSAHAPTIVSKLARSVRKRLFKEVLKAKNEKVFGGHTHGARYFVTPVDIDAAATCENRVVRLKLQHFGPKVPPYALLCWSKKKLTTTRLYVESMDLWLVTSPESRSSLASCMASLRASADSICHCLAYSRARPRCLLLVLTAAAAVAGEACMTL